MRYLILAGLVLLMGCASCEEKARYQREIPDEKNSTYKW